MILENNLALNQNTECHRIRNYINGSHKVLNRKDFEVNKEIFHTAKIILQSIKSVIDFHSSYICGNPVSITGDENISKLVQSVYRKGFFSKSDYEIAKNLVIYGNSYEHLYKEKGIIKSRIIPNTDCFPIYENGIYTKFIERYCVNPVTDYVLEREYTDTEINEYENGVLKESYKNPSGLPIHYTSGNMDRTNLFGVGVVSDLIRIMDEIEQLLSKMMDSVNNLSMNPMGVISGQRLDESVNSDISGAVINLDEGSSFSYASVDLDYQSIKLILDNLIQQFYTVACVPSALYGQGNVANVSETSLELLFNNSDSFAKRLSFGLLDGFYKRLEYISQMLGMNVTDVNIAFNFNRPIDNKSMLESLKLQFDMGAISRESIIKNSPYTVDVDREMELLNHSDLVGNNEEQIIVK